MDTPIHTLSELFTQLGLPNTGEEIERFIETHRPLPADVAIYDADFWTEPQKEFLKQQIEADADWAELIDQLNARLR